MSKICLILLGKSINRPFKIVQVTPESRVLKCLHPGNLVVTIKGTPDGWTIPEAFGKLGNRQFQVRQEDEMIKQIRQKEIHRHTLGKPRNQAGKER